MLGVVTARHPVVVNFFKKIGCVAWGDGHNFRIACCVEFFGKLWRFFFRCQKKVENVAQKYKTELSVQKCQRTIIFFLGNDCAKVAIISCRFFRSEIITTFEP